MMCGPRCRCGRPSPRICQDRTLIKPSTSGVTVWRENWIGICAAFTLETVNLSCIGWIVFCFFFWFEIWLQDFVVVGLQSASGRSHLGKRPCHFPWCPCRRGTFLGLVQILKNHNSYILEHGWRGLDTDTMVKMSQITYQHAHGTKTRARLAKTENNQNISFCGFHVNLLLSFYALGWKLTVLGLSTGGVFDVTQRTTLHHVLPLGT